MLNHALKSLRQFHKLTQTELAQSLNVSTAHISEIETGKNTITLEMLQKYAHYFDVPASHILLFSEELEAEHKNRKAFRLFIAKKIVNIMDWIIEKDAEKEKNSHK